MSQLSFRRPAMLDPEQAENIPGAEDTLVSSEVAHLVAQTVLGWHDITDKQSQKLRQLIEEGGVETVSELWATSPADTLPGTLWRLYLVHQWYVRDAETVLDRFCKGVSTASTTQAGDQAANQDQAQPEGQGEKKVQKSDEIRASVDKLMHELTCLWRGQLTLPLPELLHKVADFLLVLTYGVNADWIKDEKDELATPVTLRPRALLLTAEEMRKSALKAKSKNLD